VLSKYRKVPPEMTNFVRKSDYALIAATLAAARKEAGLSQNELGKKLGENQKFVSVIETGVRRVDFLEFSAFECALDLKALVLVRYIILAIELNLNSN
jgi:ribosome-binding protein aMBF1 (putative translation factor)